MFCTITALFPEGVLWKQVKNISEALHTTVEEDTGDALGNVSKQTVFVASITCQHYINKGQRYTK